MKLEVDAPDDAAIEFDDDAPIACFSSEILEADAPAGGAEREASSAV